MNGNHARTGAAGVRGGRRILANPTGAPSAAQLLPKTAGRRSPRARFRNACPLRGTAPGAPSVPRLGDIKPTEQTARDELVPFAVGMIRLGHQVGETASPAHEILKSGQ